MTFNHAAAEELARTIEAQEHAAPWAESGFSMMQVYHNCGSPCCIGGFAQAQLGKDIIVGPLAIYKLLNCSFGEANVLFDGMFTPIPLAYITPAMAAAAIRELSDKYRKSEVK